MKTRQRVETLAELMNTVAKALEVNTSKRNQDVYKMIEVAILGNMDRHQQGKYLEELFNRGLFARLEKYRD